MFQKATKKGAYLRMALVGPAGSGKTYTALRIATEMAKRLGGLRIAVMDTERGSASKYADLFDFDAHSPMSFAPTVYCDVIEKAAKGGYGILVIDSLSHAWSGKDGALDKVDKAASKDPKGNSFAAWRTVTPMHNQMIESILTAPLHIIATMRTKTEWVIEENDRGKKVPKKIGTQPVQRDGVDYEFDVVADMNEEHWLTIGKTRCNALDKYEEQKAGEKLAGILVDWLTNDGSAVPETGTEEADAQFNSAELDALVKGKDKKREESPTEAAPKGGEGAAKPGVVESAAPSASVGEPAWLDEKLPKIASRPNWHGHDWRWMTQGKPDGDRAKWCSAVVDNPEAPATLKRRCEYVALRIAGLA